MTLGAEGGETQAHYCRPKVRVNYGGPSVGRCAGSVYLTMGAGGSKDADGALEYLNGVYEGYHVLKVLLCKPRLNRR